MILSNPNLPEALERSHHLFFFFFLPSSFSNHYLFIWCSFISYCPRGSLIGLILVRYYQSPSSERLFLLPAPADGPAEPQPFLSTIEPYLYRLQALRVLGVVQSCFKDLARVSVRFCRTHEAGHIPR